MIWYYDIEISTISFLLLNLPYNSFRSSSKADTLDKNVKSGDLVIFFNYKHTKLYDSLVKIGAILFPSNVISLVFLTYCFLITQYLHICIILWYPF